MAAQSPPRKEESTLIFAFWRTEAGSVFRGCLPKSGNSYLSIVLGFNVSINLIVLLLVGRHCWYFAKIVSISFDR